MGIRKALEELLLIVEIHQKHTKNNFAWAEVEYAKELLAQPEKTEQEQEPVAWKVVDKTTGDFMFSRVKPNARSYTYDEVIPLYASPPKRKSLTNEQTTTAMAVMPNKEREREQKQEIPYGIRKLIEFAGKNMRSPIKSERAPPHLYLTRRDCIEVGNYLKGLGL